jgi:hypothetical protein
MNQHFENTVYYLKRAGETAHKGIESELAEARETIQDIAGEEVDFDRVEDVRADLADLQERAAGQAGDAIADACEALSASRAPKHSSGE